MTVPTGRSVPGSATIGGELAMRMLMRVHMDTAAANERIKDGTMQGVVEGMLERVRPEACYFFPEGGVRTAYLFFDLADPTDLVRLSEPLFESVRATVEFQPVMDLDDMRAALAGMAR